LRIFTNFKSWDEFYFFLLSSFDTSKYCILQGGNYNFSDLRVVIQELIHVGYQQSE